MHAEFVVSVTPLLWRRICYLPAFSSSSGHDVTPQESNRLQLVTMQTLTACLPDAPGIPRMIASQLVENLRERLSGGNPAAMIAAAACLGLLASKRIPLDAAGGTAATAAVEVLYGYYDTLTAGCAAGPLEGLRLDRMDRLWPGVMRALFGVGLLARFYDVDGVELDDEVVRGDGETALRAGAVTAALHELCMRYAVVADERVLAKLIRGMGFLLGAAPRLAVQAPSRELLCAALASGAASVRIAGLCALRELLSGEEVEANGGAALAAEGPAVEAMNRMLMEVGGACV